MDEEISLSVDTQALDRALAELPMKMQREIIGNALQAGGKLMLATMKQLAPERTDEPTPGGTSLPPGILRYDLTTQVIISTDRGARIRIGPTPIAGHVAKWQNNGWMLTGHGGRKGGRKRIKQIEGKHFIEATFDETAEAAIAVIVERLGTGFENAVEQSGADTNYGGENY